MKISKIGAIIGFFFGLLLIVLIITKSLPAFVYFVFLGFSNIIKELINSILFLLPRSLWNFFWEIEIYIYFLIVIIQYIFLGIIIGNLIQFKEERKLWLKLLLIVIAILIVFSFIFYFLIMMGAGS